MPKILSEKDFSPIIEAVRHRPAGAALRDIAKELDQTIRLPTLQVRLRKLVDQGRLDRVGTRKAARYFVPSSQPVASSNGSQRSLQHSRDDAPIPLSEESQRIKAKVGSSLGARRPVGYNRAFLEAYRPNHTFFLSARERAHLSSVGKPATGDQPAGTYAKQILARLLVDLAWNSSRLEGNTYSLLDTRRLIEFGEEAEGKNRLEAQMILNHKDAIEFLVGFPDETKFDRRTILNLHALLANNLLPDPDAAGRLRRMAVGIEKSVFHPLETPQLIEECFDILLRKTKDIEDPFEQSFFFLAQLPYLQPFDDVNKRVSRLGANIPFIKGNLAPLAFTDVPQSLYTQAILGIYELNQIDLLKDLFMWAYERSAARYAAVRQSLGEPDPFRVRHRDDLRDVVRDAVVGRMNRKAASAHIASWTMRNIASEERGRFRETAENDLLGLHEGNYARYRVRPSEFDAWRAVWDKQPETAG